MSDPHTASAIAQLVFYAPMVPCTLFFCVRNWKYHPRTAWYPPVPFALIRLIGAILVIVYKQDTSNLGVLIGAIVTLNVGLIPLILGFLGLTRVVTESSFKDHRALRITMKLIRHVIIIAASLLGTAGGFTGQPAQATLQSTLSRVAYLLFLAILVVLTGICVWIFLQRDQLKPGDRIYNRWIFIAIPFLFIRAAFGLASVFSASGNQILTSIWSPLFGSAVLFSLMALLPEYIVLVIYQYLAFHRWRTGKAEEEAKIAREHRRARRNHRSERDDGCSDRHLELGSDDA